MRVSESKITVPELPTAFVPRDHLPDPTACALGKELDQACGELVTLSCHRRSGPLARPG